MDVEAEQTAERELLVLVSFGNLARSGGARSPFVPCLLRAC